jgi:predicted nuclease of predicted toxin-antitoxin system
VDLGKSAQFIAARRQLDKRAPMSLTQGMLETQGCDTLHTFDLPEGNCSSDDSIREKADQDERVVFSKDKDFIQSHLLLGPPRKDRSPR